MERLGRGHRPRKFHKKRKKYPITPSKDEDEPIKSLGWKEDCLPYIKEHWRGKKNPSVKKIEIIGDTPGSSSSMGERILEECSVLTETKFENNRTFLTFRTSNIKEIEAHREEDRKRRAREEHERVKAKKQHYLENPEKRFDIIKEIYEKSWQRGWGLKPIYVIPLREDSPKETSEFPNNDIPKLRLENRNHGEKGNLYVGMTGYGPEDIRDDPRTESGIILRFFRHLEQNTAVTKYRKPERAPYEKTIAEIEELTRKYGAGWPGKSGEDSHQLEFYVGWALFMCGYDVWGPKLSDPAFKRRNLESLTWLGEEPYW